MKNKIGETPSAKYKVQTFVDEAVETLKMRGITIPRKPTVARAFPVDLTKKTGEQLGKLQSYFRAQLGYVLHQSALTDFAILFVAREYTNTKRRWFLHLDPGDKSMTKDSIEGRVHNVPEVKELDNLYTILQGELIVWNNSREELKGYLETISRELSRRGMELRAGLE
jgi:hypothetical protein